MSHTDSDNFYEDDEMFAEPSESDMPFVEYLYDDCNDFFDEDDSMDGDAESAFGSCGWGVDEYYNSDNDYGEDY